MASHDTGRRKMRAISQDNSASIQMLNAELRNLKEGREESNKNRPKRTVGDTRKRKS